MQSSPQYSPAQILDAGRRAEADGRREQALQLYQYLYDHFGRTEEGRLAHEALLRLNNARNGGNGASHPERDVASRPTGHAHPPQHTTVPPMRRAQAQGVYPAKDHYRLGRFVARFIGIMGWLAFASGLVLILSGLSSLFVPQLGALLFGFGLYAAGLGTVSVISGLIIVCLGQIARAVFDTANASRDVAYLRRMEMGAPVEE